MLNICAHIIAKLLWSGQWSTYQSDWFWVLLFLTLLANFTKWWKPISQCPGITALNCCVNAEETLLQQWLTRTKIRGAVVLIWQMRPNKTAGHPTVKPHSKSHWGPGMLSLLSNWAGLVFVTEDGVLLLLLQWSHPGGTFIEICEEIFNRYPTWQQNIRECTVEQSCRSYDKKGIPYIRNPRVSH